MRVAASEIARGLAHQTVNAFGRAIVAGEFAAGDVLPQEAALAARFGVGRSALREAVKMLAGKGLIRTARRYGSRVCPREEWNLLDRDVLAWHAEGDAAAVSALIVEITAVFLPSDANFLILAMMVW